MLKTVARINVGHSGLNLNDLESFIQKARERGATHLKQDFAKRVPNDYSPDLLIAVRDETEEEKEKRIFDSLTPEQKSLFAKKIGS